MNCKYYKKENPKESRCVKDSNVGYCIVEVYSMNCRCENENK